MYVSVCVWFRENGSVATCTCMHIYLWVCLCMPFLPMGHSTKLRHNLWQCPLLLPVIFALQQSKSHYSAKVKHTSARTLQDLLCQFRIHMQEKRCLTADITRDTVTNCASTSSNDPYTCSSMLSDLCIRSQDNDNFYPAGLGQAHTAIHHV